MLAPEFIPKAEVEYRQPMSHIRAPLMRLRGNEAACRARATGDKVPIPGSERCPGGRHGSPPPVFSPGESYVPLGPGRRSPEGRRESDTPGSDEPACTHRSRAHPRHFIWVAQKSENVQNVPVWWVWDLLLGLIPSTPAPFTLSTS